MKIRQGFVTNSSSSSFVVAFNSIPQSVEEVKEILFGKRELVSVYDYSSSTLDVARRVFNDIQGQKPNNIDAIVDAIGSGGIPDLPGSIEFSDPDGQGGYDDKFHEVCNRLSGDYAGKLLSELSGGGNRVVLTFRYADEDGETLLEHGEIFNALPNRRFSHH